MIIVEFKALLSHSHHCPKHEVIELGYFASDMETKMYDGNGMPVDTTTGKASVIVKLITRMQFEMN